MEVIMKLDLTRYTDNQVAMFFVNGIISRSEFERWRRETGSDVEVADVNQD